MTPRQLIKELKLRGVLVALAESCTGGLAAGALTAVPGSSDVFERGFVTYSNEAKHEVLGVPRGMLNKHGAVSREVAIAMALGALKYSRANVAVSVTGIAGPGGGSRAKPVGLVHFACVMKGREPVHLRKNYGDIGRAVVRNKSVKQVLNLLESMTLGEQLSGPRFKS
jgi:nicotinamide-nucleotide amidase